MNRHLLWGLGVFLLAFGGLAHYYKNLEKKGEPSLGGHQSNVESEPLGTSRIDESFSGSPAAQLAEWFELLKKDAHLSASSSVLIKKQNHFVSIEVSGEDAFALGEAVVRKSLLPTLEHIALQVEKGIRQGMTVDIVGYGDENHRELETRAGPFGRTDFNFSYQRAEWMAHYLMGQLHGPQMEKRVRVIGSGLIPKGLKVEIRFYSSSSSFSKSSG